MEPKPSPTVLFVHNNFPGQFGFLAERLAADGFRCLAIGASTSRAPPGVQLWTWRTGRGSTPGIFPAAIRAEADLIRGRAAAACALAIRDAGHRPDLIIGHPGWGETLHLREIFPQTPQILHGEFYYDTHGGDVGFDPEFGDMDWEERFRINAKNATVALAYVDADRIVCPTPYQRARFPSVFQNRIALIHEGVDTDAIRPRPPTPVRLAGGRMLDGARPVITYVSRTLEPLRGFHIFLRALPELLRAVPEAEVLVIGESDRAGYGTPPPKGRSWKQVYLESLGSELDLSRVHFLGAVPHATMLAALSISWAHIYLTYPFVLSWSLLEAMASQCLIIGSDTPPVRDALADGETAVLVDFFDVEGLSRAMIEACRSQDRYKPMRARARQAAVANFDRNRRCLPDWRRLVDETLATARAETSD